MLSHAIVGLLLCPQCRLAGLDVSCTEANGRLLNGSLVCNSCHATYAVEDGIPHLKQGVLENDPEWEIWRNHLDGFAARRALRSTIMSSPREERWSQKMQAFGDFVNVPDGRILDVGCGPGNLRKVLDPNRVTYFGIDPLPVEEVEGFAFVCAVAESIPFRAGTFSSVVVRSALDHFRDLNAFFEEVSRVLTEDGQVFLEQVVHRSSGFDGVVRDSLHAVKDLIDGVRTLKQRKSAPKHMREFSQESLMRAVEHGGFEVSRSQVHHSNWYTPTQMFFKLSRRDRKLDC